MKKQIVSIFALALASQCILAQPPDHRPHDDPQDEPPHRDYRPDSPFKMAMKELQKQDPEKFEELKELRMADPAAFREEIEMIVHTAVMQKLEADRPEVHAAIANLSPEEQEWVVRLIAREKFSGEHRKRGGKYHKEGSRDDRKNVRQLIKSYRKSDSEDEKSEIRAKLKEHIANQYDKRLEMRKLQLTEMEGKLDDARKALAMGEEEKESFIEEKLTHMLEGKRQKDRPPHDKPID